MPIRDEQIRALLIASSETRQEEIDCDECLEWMASYAEATVAGGPLPAALEKVRAHCCLCQNCAEETRLLNEWLGERGR